jgi:hypothetical protein
MSPLMDWAVQTLSNLKSRALSSTSVQKEVPTTISKLKTSISLSKFKTLVSSSYYSLQLQHSSSAY